MLEQPDEKRMRLRYAGTCRVCGSALEARSDAIYERASRTVRCLRCAADESPSETRGPAPTPGAGRSPAQKVQSEQRTGPTDDTVDPGTAGASARREHQRRRARREDRIRARHPRLGGLILALSDDPQTTTAWHAGALGEERLGRRLDELASPMLRVLHDRRVPGSRANIDHVAVTPTGIYVIDAKRYVDKRPSLRVDGGVLRPRVERLMVGSRDQTKLVEGALKQVDLVRTLVEKDLPVAGILCFIESDWPLVGGSFTIREVDVLWPKKLYPRLAADGPHASTVAAVHARLAEALPPA